MTTLEACELIVDLTRQLAAARRQRDVYREMVSVALTHLHEKGCELKQEHASRLRLIEELRALRERERKATAA